MNALTADELRKWQSEGKDFALVDVREHWEHEAFNIGGLLAPLGTIMAATEHFPNDKPVVLYCEKGIRSVIAIQRLQALGFENLYNLSGGVHAWRESGSQQGKL